MCRLLEKSGALAGFFLTALSVMAVLLPAVVHGYTFFRGDMGRADRHSFYDLPGSSYPQQNNAVYQFGKVGAFNALPPGVTNAMVLPALTGAASDWSQWGNYAFDTSALGAVNTGLVRLRYDATKPIGAHVDGIGVGGTFAQMTFGREASLGVAWNATNFGWTMRHEMGHILGLHDLYAPRVGPPYAEEFVDHPINQAANPNRAAAGLRDNIMFQYRYNGNDYSLAPQTIIDNDEIAAVTWIWGGSHNQLVTGDLANAWNGPPINGGRDTARHHGQNNAKQWTYMGSIVNSGFFQPYVDIDFAGYMGLAGTTYGKTSPTFTYGGNQGGTLERFYVNENGWTGNFELNLTSSFSREMRVRAFINTSGVFGNTSFILDPVVEGLGYIAAGATTAEQFVMPFGPDPSRVPEPGTLVMTGMGSMALLIAHRLRRRPKASGLVEGVGLRTSRQLEVE